MRKQVVLFVVIVLTSALLSVVCGMFLADVARATTDCLAAPNTPSPQGSHWYYRVDRVNKRRCWYLGPQGKKVRPDAGQVASTELPRTIRPSPELTATTPVEEQPKIDAVGLQLNAAPSGEGTLAPLGEALAKSESVPRPGQSQHQPAVMSDLVSDEPPKANPEDEMPLIWPVLAGAELAASAPPTTTLPNLAYMLAVLAGMLALAGFFGRAILKHAAERQFDGLQRTLGSAHPMRSSRLISKWT